jgi:hypothetical protein
MKGFSVRMAEVTRVEEKYESVERVITEDVLVRSEGFDVFLTKEEANGLRTLLYCGVGIDVLENLNLRDLSNALAKAGAKHHYPHWDSYAMLKD